MHPKQPQSISITSPDSQIRICFAFCKLKKPLYVPHSGENPRKGAAAPFLVVLRGIVKGENRNSPLTGFLFTASDLFL